MDIEVIISKKIDDVFEFLDNNNYFDNENTKGLNDGDSYISNNDSIISCENYVNKAHFTFDQIFSIEKIEDEIWHLEFSFSNTYFATCTRNGVISIYKIEINKKTQNEKENQINIQNESLKNRDNIDNPNTKQIEIQNSNLNNTHTHNLTTYNINNIINLDSIFPKQQKPSSEFPLNSLSIECLNTFLSHKKV